MNIIIYTHIYKMCGTVQFLQGKKLHGGEKLDGMIVCSEIIYAFNFIKDNLNFSGKYQ